MPEVNTLFQPVGQFCRHAVVTCTGADPLVTVAATMRIQNISSVVVDSPTPDNILTGSMFFDLRTLYGDLSLELALKAHIAARLQVEPMFLRVCRRQRPALQDAARLVRSHQG